MHEALRSTTVYYVTKQRRSRTCAITFAHRACEGEEGVGRGGGGGRRRRDRTARDRMLLAHKNSSRIPTILSLRYFVCRVSTLLRTDKARQVPAQLLCQLWATCGIWNMDPPLRSKTASPCGWEGCRLWVGQTRPFGCLASPLSNVQDWATRQ